MFFEFFIDFWVLGMLIGIVLVFVKWKVGSVDLEDVVDF